MREMVLNHASIQASHEHEIFEWLNNTAKGIALLVQNQIVIRRLRTMCELNKVLCLPDFSIYQALYKLNKHADSRDSALFMLQLTTMYPLTEQLDAEVVNRFRGTESQIPNISVIEGEPLVLCALLNGVAVGYPSLGWNSSSITVKFDELLDNGEINLVSEEIDNVASLEHAKTVLRRHVQQSLVDINNWGEFWSKRGDNFTNLQFGIEVENQLTQIPKSYLNTVTHKVWKLDEAVRRWRNEQTDLPQWGSFVSPESTHLMQNERFRRSRQFRSGDGTIKTYEWHARYGSSGRIHFRFNQSDRTIEIGYIGKHLPSH